MSISREAIEAAIEADRRYRFASRDIEHMYELILTAALPHLYGYRAGMAEGEARFWEERDRRKEAEGRIAELEAALFECAVLAGEDVSGGVPTRPPLAEWVVRAVRELRCDYDEAAA